MTCTGSIAMCEGEPDSTSAYADEGTAAHFLGSECLTHGARPATYIGQQIVIDGGVTRTGGV